MSNTTMWKLLTNFERAAHAVESHQAVEQVGQLQEPPTQIPIRSYCVSEFLGCIHFFARNEHELSTTLVVQNCTRRGRPFCKEAVTL